MTAYSVYVDVRKPACTGTTSGFEADRQGSLMALINQPSGY